MEYDIRAIQKYSREERKKRGYIYYRKLENYITALLAKKKKEKRGCRNMLKGKQR